MFSNPDMAALLIFFLAVIPAGAVVRIGISALQIFINPDDEPTIKKRIKTMLWFVIVAECALSLVLKIYSYYL